MTPGPTTPTHASPRGVGGSGSSACVQGGSPERASGASSVDTSALGATVGDASVVGASGVGTDGAAGNGKPSGAGEAAGGVGRECNPPAGRRHPSAAPRAGA